VKRGHDHPDVRAWLWEQPREQRSTEVFVPVVIGTSPVWSHSEDRGGFYGLVEVNLPLDLDPIYECDHVHDSRAEAWTCAEDAARRLVDAALQRRDG
jgi:hypothetical protein